MEASDTEHKLSDEFDSNSCKNAVKNEVDETAKLKSQLAYLAADFDNYKKRVAKDSLGIVKNADKDFFIDLLPILDAFEYAKTANMKVTGENDVELKEPTLDEHTPRYGEEGINLIYGSLIKAINKHGFKKIDVDIGDAFDVDKHEAIMSVKADDDIKDGQIAQIFSSGWTLDGKLVRATKVAVASEK